MPIAAGVPDERGRRCPTCLFRLRLRKGLVRAPLYAECPRCQSLLLFARGTEKSSRSAFAAQVAALSSEDRRRFYEELIAHLANVIDRAVDRKADPTDKLRQIRYLTEILRCASYFLRLPRREADGDPAPVDEDIFSGFCVFLDRRSRKAVVAAVAASYREVTGREIE